MNFTQSQKHHTNHTSRVNQTAEHQNRQNP